MNTYSNGMAYPIIQNYQQMQKRTWFDAHSETVANLWNKMQLYFISSSCDYSVMPQLLDMDFGMTDILFFYAHSQ